MKHSRPKIELFLDKQGQGRYRVKAANGRILCQSEGYKGRTPEEAVDMAWRGSRALRSAATTARTVWHRGN